MFPLLKYAFLPPCYFLIFSWSDFFSINQFYHFNNRFLFWFDSKKTLSKLSFPCIFALFHFFFFFRSFLIFSPLIFSSLSTHFLCVFPVIFSSPQQKIYSPHFRLKTLFSPFSRFILAHFSPSSFYFIQPFFRSSVNFIFLSGDFNYPLDFPVDFLIIHKIYQREFSLRPTWFTT